MPSSVNLQTYTEESQEPKRNQARGLRRDERKTESWKEKSSSENRLELYVLIVRGLAGALIWLAVVFGRPWVQDSVGTTELYNGTVLLGTSTSAAAILALASKLVGRELWRVHEVIWIRRNRPSIGAEDFDHLEYLHRYRDFLLLDRKPVSRSTLQKIENEIDARANQHVVRSMVLANSQNDSLYPSFEVL